MILGGLKNKSNKKCSLKLYELVFGLDFVAGLVYKMSFYNYNQFLHL